MAHLQPSSSPPRPEVPTDAHVQTIGLNQHKACSPTSFSGHNVQHPWLATMTPRASVSTITAMQKDIKHLSLILCLTMMMLRALVRASTAPATSTSWCCRASPLTWAVTVVL